MIAMFVPRDAVHTPAILLIASASAPYVSQRLGDALGEPLARWCAAQWVHDVAALRSAAGHENDRLPRAA
jgi:hypothetical protein